MILNFLNLVEDEQTQFLVEAVEHHHLVERGVRLVAVAPWAFAEADTYRPTNGITL